MIVKRRCINSVSTEAFEIFIVEMSESGGIGTSGSVVLIVTDAPVLGSDGELVEPQSFSPESVLTLGQ